MGGFRHDGQGGGDARRGHLASFGGPEHLQQHYHTIRRSRSTPEDQGGIPSDPAAAAHSLPGFATFLRQSPPHHEHSSFTPERSALSSQSRQRQLQRREERQPHHGNSVSTFSTYNHLLGSVEDAITRTQSHRSSFSDTSGGSPNLNEFKNITINSAFSLMRPLKTSTGSYHMSDDSVGSEPARTRTSYKPTANRSSVNINLPLPPQQQRPPARTSRYLREIDRRNILRRIEQGEKQANLAKEYQVSRAAISNLKQRRKNRNRKDQRPIGRERASEETRRYEHSGGSNQGQLQQLSEQFARERLAFSGTSNHNAHQLRGGFPSSVYSGERYDSANEQARSLSPVSSSSGVSPYPESEFASPMEETFDRVIEVKTVAMEILLTRLIGPRADAQTSQLAKSRIARLLLENAIGEFPTRNLQIPMTTSTPSSYYLGAAFTKPICAVKILSDHGVDASAALLHEFQTLEPFCEIGSSAFTSVSSPSSQRAAGTKCIVHLPQNIHESNVLLLVDLLDARSSEEVAKALQAILRASIQQRNICVVAICSHERVLRYLLELSPQLRIVTAKVLAHEDPSSRDIGDLLRSRLHFQ